jgi:hypothetical protein
MEGEPIMSHYRWKLYSLAILITLFTVSCSPPGQDLQTAKASSTAAAENANKPDADAAPAVQPEPPRPARIVDEVKKPVEPPRPVRQAPAPKPPEPAAAPLPPAPASTPIAAPAPAPQPVASAPQPAPIVVPAPQSDPIPVPGPPPPPEPTTKKVTIPAGTDVYIRMIDSIQTDRAHENETFRASMDKDIVVDGKTIVPRRSDVFVKVIEVEQAGKLKGQSELQVQLDRIFIGKQAYSVTSNTFTQTGDSEGKKAARNVGIGAAVGGVLGGILGGTKGAVIGAGAGGGGGAVITKPEPLRINSETQMLFKLDNPLEVTISTGAPSSSTTSGGADGPVRFTVPPPTVRDRDRSTQDSSRTTSSSQDDLTGDWTLTTDGPEYMNLRLSLRQDGNNLSGSITNPRGSGTLPIRGSISGNYISFTTQSQYGGYNTQIQFSGAVDRDMMQGNVNMPSNASYGGGYPGGGYPGGGYPGGGRRTGGGATTQLHWTARRSD